MKGIFDRSNKEVGGKRYNDFLKLLFNDKGEDLISQKSLIEPVFDPEDIQFETHSKDKNKLFKELSYEVIGEELVIQFETTENYPTTLGERELFFFLLRELVISFKSKPFLFTAERLGIALFYKELDAARNSIIQELQAAGSIGTGQIDLNAILRRSSAYYAFAIKQNIDYTREIESYTNQLASIENKYILNLFEKLAGGTYSKLPNEEIHFLSSNTKNVFNIPLYLASSSARALSDIYFYLKHLAKSGQVLMIDEPESHLTLDKQRLMARLIVAIVNSGIKVWITTHSDFLLREINNLIILSKNAGNKHKFLENFSEEYSELDFINPSRVSIYSVQNGLVHDVPVTQNGMGQTIFDEAIQKSNDLSGLLEYYFSND